MADHTNYVLVERDGWQLYRSTWRSRILDVDLVSGPAAAIRCIRAQETTDVWYDDGICEGAVLVDVTRRVVLFFTCQLNDYAHRAALLTVLARTWRGWHVQWAFDGVADLVAYVGLERAMVRDSGLVDAVLAAEDDDVDQLVTLRREDGGHEAYGFSLDLFDVLRYGPEMVGLLPQEARIETCPFPRSGVHIDLADRHLGLWAFDPLRGMAEWLPPAWPGWRIELWADRYTEHLGRSAVPVGEWDRSAGLDFLAGRVDLHADEPAKVWAAIADLRA
nr:hypothetical protein [Kibdelosporangium sp. MJ126-NF4]CEL19159.1 hypothetical protein [Kibdelosporangium sp. MJ126-NF4]